MVKHIKQSVDWDSFHRTWIIDCLDLVKLIEQSIDWDSSHRTWIIDCFDLVKHVWQSIDWASSHRTWVIDCFDSVGLGQQSIDWESPTWPMQCWSIYLWSRNHMCLFFVCIRNTSIGYCGYPFSWDLSKVVIATNSTTASNTQTNISNGLIDVDSNTIMSVTNSRVCHTSSHNPTIQIMTSHLLEEGQSRAY